MTDPLTGLNPDDVLQASGGWGLRLTAESAGDDRLMSREADVEVFVNGGMKRAWPGGPHDSIPPKARVVLIRPGAEHRLSTAKTIQLEIVDCEAPKLGPADTASLEPETGSALAVTRAGAGWTSGERLAPSTQLVFGSKDVRVTVDSGPPEAVDVRLSFDGQTAEDLGDRVGYAATLRPITHDGDVKPIHG